MKFNDCPLRNELKEGVFQYGRDNSISPLSLIEKLLEEFLYKKGYLVVGVVDEDVPFPAELNQPRITHAVPTRSGRFEIRHMHDGKNWHYGVCDYEDAKILVEFLKHKNWDTKYSTSQTKLKGKKQIDFLFGEMEKESELMETE